VSNCSVVKRRTLSLRREGTLRTSALPLSMRELAVPGPMLVKMFCRVDSRTESCWDRKWMDRGLLLLFALDFETELY